MRPRYARVVVALFWIWLAAAAVLYSDPGCGPGMFGSLFVGGILIVVAVPLGLTWGLASALGRPTVPWGCRMKRAWWSAPIAFAFGFGISATDLALTVRVWLCESELRAFAGAVPREAAPGRGVAPQRVGLFHVRGAGARGADTHLNIGSGFFSQVGVAHRPEGGPLEVIEGQTRTRYRHLFGPWYQFESAHMGPLF